MSRCSMLILALVAGSCSEPQPGGSSGGGGGRVKKKATQVASQTMNPALEKSVDTSMALFGDLADAMSSTGVLPAEPLSEMSPVYGALPLDQSVVSGADLHALPDTIKKLLEEVMDLRAASLYGQYEAVIQKNKKEFSQWAQEVSRFESDLLIAIAFPEAVKEHPNLLIASVAEADPKLVVDFFEPVLKKAAERGVSLGSQSSILYAVEEAPLNISEDEWKEILANEIEVTSDILAKINTLEMLRRMVVADGEIPDGLILTGEPALMANWAVALANFESQAPPPDSGSVVSSSGEVSLSWENGRREVALVKE